MSDDPLTSQDSNDRGIDDALNEPTFIATEDLRSASDNGAYPEFVKQAVLETRLFTQFKRHPIYRQILEHVNQEQGEQYLEIISGKWPELLKRIDEFKANDRIGNPIQHTYPGVGAISPTTLRYLKVCCDLREAFGSLDGMDVAEIGVGYGGQFFLSDRVWQLGSWTMFDLDPVLQLTSRFLECHLINSAYLCTTLNRFDGRNAKFDLVISNYAFSEIPKQLQMKYIGKVMSKARCGYLTMNSGKADDCRDRLSIDELRKSFPSLQVLDEVPLTGHKNYILIWR
jgi:hypothetical protein